MSHAHSDNIDMCVDKILDLRSKQKEAEKELVECIDKMCADLATEIRRLQPNLSVMMKTSGCDICYRTRILSCLAKPYDGCWNFDTTEFGCQFNKRYPECRQLSCCLIDLAASIVDFFNNHFRSLS